MWYTILITLVVDFGGLLLVYLLLRDRVRRATSSESRIAEIRDEVSRLLVELNQATDRNIALMEDKITVLNEAISTADKKIGLLRRETEKHDVGSQIYSRLAEGRPPRARCSSRTGGAARAEPRRSRGRSAACRVRQRGAVPPAAAPQLAVELSERTDAREATVRHRDPAEQAAEPRAAAAARRAAESDDALPRRASRLPSLPVVSGSPLGRWS